MRNLDLGVRFVIGIASLYKSSSQLSLHNEHLYNDTSLHSKVTVTQHPIHEVAAFCVAMVTKYMYAYGVTEQRPACLVHVCSYCRSYTVGGRELLLLH